MLCRRVMKSSRAVDGRKISGRLGRGSILLVISMGRLMPGTPVMKTMAPEMANEVFVGVF